MYGTGVARHAWGGIEAMATFVLRLRHDHFRNKRLASSLRLNQVIRMQLDARYPRNPLTWAPVLECVTEAGEFPFLMQRDNPRPGATLGSKQFSGFKSVADVVAYHRW